MAKDINASRDQLLRDFNQVVNDTEELLRAIANVGGEKAAAARESVEENLATAKKRLRELQGSAVERATDAARATDDYVHEKPWQAIAVAAGVGVIVGLLLNSRR
jgi:ElaB/YqjD/DUF883 family membrane-anchored ribosome-binding protein